MIVLDNANRINKVLAGKILGYDYVAGGFNIKIRNIFLYI